MVPIAALSAFSSPEELFSFLLPIPHNTPSCRRKLAELVADHVFGDGDAVVDLAVVHVEAQANEARQNGRRASLRAYGGRRVARLLGPYDW
jgi:hypothetical protein